MTSIQDPLMQDPRKAKFIGAKLNWSTVILTYEFWGLQLIILETLLQLILPYMVISVTQ